MNTTPLCVLSSMGWGVRNVLMSKGIEVVAQHRPVHTMTTFHHHQPFLDRFAHLAGHAELLPLDIKDDPKARRLYYLNTFIHYKLTATKTHRRKLRERDEQGRTDRLERLAIRTAHPVTLGLTRDLLARRLRKSESYTTSKAYFKAAGIRDVLAAHPLALDVYPALLAAKDLGLSVTALITSWDHLTSKRPLLIPFDRYLVWNDVMADHARRQYNPAGDKVHQIGPLQFDYYFQPERYDDRETFLTGLGLDPSRKTVVYSSVTPGNMRTEPQLVRRLLDARLEGRIDGNPNLLFRTHPKRPIAHFEESRYDPRYAELPIAWTQAGEPTHNRADRWCPLDDEVRLLANTVRHGDANLNHFSTMMLDFAVVDTPAVLVAFNGLDEPFDYRGGYEHFGDILDCEAHRIAHTFDEMIAHLNADLAHPQTHAAGRATLAQRFGGGHLGHSWKRLAKDLLRVDTLP